MRDLKIYVSIASVLLIFYLLGQYNRPMAIDWTKTLNNNEKMPFGTYVVYNRIHDIFPGAKVTTFREPIYNVINDSNVKKGTYIIICNYATLNEYDYSKLKNFIKNGNDVFISANGFGPFLKKELKVETDFEYQTKDAMRIWFTNKNVSTYQYAIDRSSTNGYFSSFDTTKAVVLGKNDSLKSNYIKYGIGKGNLYLHTCPLMFSNYAILEEQGSAYSAIALSYLKNDKSIIWDEYYTQGREGDESIMRVFLHNTNLRNAFYIALAALLIFAVYEIKRRQRIIPVIEPLANTTIDFVNVVGQVYYEQRNNKNIAEKKASYFLEHVRNKYQLRTNVLDDAFVDTLAKKSGADIKIIHDLANQIIRIRVQSEYNDAELIAFNKNIEQFNIQSR